LTFAMGTRRHTEANVKSSALGNSMIPVPLFNPRKLKSAAFGNRRENKPLSGCQTGNSRSGLKRDGFGSKRYRALIHCLRMIFSENRCTLFRIVRYWSGHDVRYPHRPRGRRYCVG
jgi:hypothetical protein